jgi:hypothetical protein
MTIYLGMDWPTRRLLKVYLRLGWLKLHAYYEKLTSVAYAGAVVMNPYRKLEFLSRLWKHIPDNQATGYYNNCKKRLKALWEKRYKDREVEDEILQPALLTSLITGITPACVCNTGIPWDLTTSYKILAVVAAIKWASKLMTSLSST